MSTPLLAFDKPEPETPAPTRTTAKVVHIYSTPARLSVSTLSLGRFNQRLKERDSRAIDYLVIGVLSLFIHTAAVDFFNRLPKTAETLLEPVKIPPKVQISFVQPKPKAPVPPPPPPKVVALNKPPKPKIKPKPAPKLVQPPPTLAPVSPTAEPTPIQSAPVIAAPAPPPPKPVEKVTQPSSGADYLNNPAPNYPDVAMDRGWEGKVQMKVHVLASGRPDKVSVIKSSGYDVLDDEAVRTVKKWSFVPGKRGNTPIDGWVTVPIAFNLQN